MSIRSLVSTLAGLLLAAAVQAAPVTLELSASGFQNAGVQYPGFDGLVTVRLSWDALNLQDPIAQFTDIDITIAGHHYAMNEIGIANQGSTQTAFGALFNGANAVVGSGAAHDFLIVFDRVLPRIDAFAYSIEGKTGAIWWTPTFTHAEYVTNNVPEPSSLALAALAVLGAAGAATRRCRRENT